MLDAVPVARSSSTGTAEGEGGSATTVWPAEAGPLPTADEPVLALVMVPTRAAAAGTTAGADSDTGEPDAAPAPTWVFPFDRPLPPGAGDNQALAVNTADGSVAYDVSFALVWADGDTAVNRNEAYALASCSGCRTVAVAFQVVLLVGSVDVVVPENISAAVNYGCLRCVTSALATQLVLTVPGELSEQGARDLAAVWAELQAFGEQLADVPLSELRARLTEYEQRIAAVVRREGRPQQAAPDDGAGAGSPTPSSPAEAGPTRSSPAGATSGSTTSAAPTATSGGTSGRTSSGGGTSSGTPSAATSAAAAASSTTASPSTSSAPAPTSGGEPVGAPASGTAGG